MDQATRYNVKRQGADLQRWVTLSPRYSNTFCKTRHVLFILLVWAHVAHVYIVTERFGTGQAIVLENIEFSFKHIWSIWQRLRVLWKKNAYLRRSIAKESRFCLSCEFYRPRVIITKKSVKKLYKHYHFSREHISGCKIHGSILQISVIQIYISKRSRESKV